jgi:hypothetical protein
VSYSVISDTTGLFSEGGGLSIQTSTGLIVGTPLNGKSGSFKIKASGITGSN